MRLENEKASKRNGMDCDGMNLRKYDLEELLLAALKSEVESNNVYSKIARRVKNALLKDKLVFLAKEEEKHRQYVEQIYKRTFPGKKPILPKTTQVPLPPLALPDEDTPLSTVLKTAMQAELAAKEFYTYLSTRFQNASIRNTLSYFADMELQHYKILEIEKESMDRFEEADVYWPMVHAGP
jgi:rubrerythrin